MRAVHRVLLLVPALVVVVAVVLVLAARPGLEDARDEVEAAWVEVGPSLDARYELLAAATTAIGDATGPSGELADEVDDALDRWRTARADGAGVADQVEAANALEGLARRLEAAVRASPRLSAMPSVVGALDAFAAAEPPEGLEAFDAATRAYADERSGVLRAPVAALLGYQEVPVLDAATSPALDAAA